MSLGGLKKASCEINVFFPLFVKAKENETMEISRRPIKMLQTKKAQPR